MQVNINLLQSLNIFAAGKKDRFYLQGVYIETQAKGIALVATDGKTMACALQDWHGADEMGGFIVPSELIAKVKVKKHTDMAEISRAQGYVTIEYCGDKFSAQEIDGSFPAWSRVIPTKLNNELAHFNPSDLIKFSKAMAMMGLGKDPVPTVFHNGQDPALVDMGMTERDGFGWQWFGVAMPFRASAMAIVPPDVSWTTQKQDQAA